MDTMIVAIIRGFEPDVCLRLAEAYYKGGINMVEVTFNQKYPRTWKDTAAAIKAIKDTFNDSVMVGAGTVLTEEQLKICEDAGGEFMVTPNMNASLIRKCVADGLMAMPGALTPTEAVEAYNAGAKYVKIFPAGVLGPGYIKAITAPLSHIPFLPPPFHSKWKRCRRNSMPGRMPGMRQNIWGWKSARKMRCRTGFQE